MENIRRGFVCVSEHKSHSHAIKAARLASHQDVLKPFFPCLFVLRSLCCPFSLLHTCLKGKNGLSLVFCPFHHSSHLHEWSDIIYSFIPPPVPAFALSSLPTVKVARRRPLAKTPSHCKRMRLSRRKQSAFIMSYLPGPPRQRVMIPGRRERECLGSRSVALRNSSVLKACLESLCWNWMLSWITPFCLFFFVVCLSGISLLLFCGESLVSARTKQKDKRIMDGAENLAGFGILKRLS